MASHGRSKKVYLETEFQKAIRSLSFEEFCGKTNIYEIVQDGYQKAGEEKKIPIAVMSAAQFNQYAKHYYERLHKLHLWHKSGLKNLKWKLAAAQSEILPVISAAQPKVSEVASIAVTRAKCDSEPKQKNSNGEKMRAKSTHNAKVSVKASKVPVAATVVSNNLAATREIDNASIFMSDTLVFEKTSSQFGRARPMATIFDPNEFQADIIAMNFDEFVAETNIEDIARAELQHRSERTKRPASADEIDARIKLYYEKRYRVDEWWPCGLKHLKYKLCECKRNRKGTADAMAQSDVRPQQDACTQYESDTEFHVPPARQANEGVVVLPAAPTLVSQSTQTEQPQDDAGNPMADPSQQNAPRYVPEAERLQQIAEPMSVNEANDGNLSVNATIDGQDDDDVVTDEVQNGETFEAIRWDDSSKAARVIDANEDIEMVCVADANRESVLVSTEPTQQPVFIDDTQEQNTENMFREVMGEWEGDTDISDQLLETTPMEMEREMREAMHKRQASAMEQNVICELDTENTNPNRIQKPRPQSKKWSKIMDVDNLMIPSFKLSVATEQPINETSQAFTASLKLTKEILNADNSVFSRWRPTEDGDEYSAQASLPFNADGDSQKRPLSGNESSISGTLFPTPPDSMPLAKNSNDFRNPKKRSLEESNSNGADFEEAEPPMKKQKLIEVEHSYATGSSSVLRPESRIDTTGICIDVNQPSVSSNIQAEICIVQAQSPPLPLQQYEAFIFKIPQGHHHEFLYHFNVECTFRRLRVGPATSSAAVINCHKQTNLQKTLRLSGKSLHRVTLQGECPKKLCQLKCTSWKDVPILLEIVKNFAYNSSVSQPPPMSILGRVLYHFFVKNSKFTSVHIQNIQSDSRELNTSYGLKPNGKRVRPPNDPFYLDSFSYNSKRSKKQ